MGKQARMIFELHWAKQAACWTLFEWGRGIIHEYLGANQRDSVERARAYVRGLHLPAQLLVKGKHGRWSRTAYWFDRKPAPRGLAKGEFHMKRIAAMILVATLWLTPLLASADSTDSGPMTIGGGAVGWQTVGPDHNVGNDFTTFYYGGLRVRRLSDKTDLFTVYQHVSLEEAGVSGDGGRFILSSEAPFGFNLLAGLGFLSNVADGKVGVTVDGGVSWALTEYIVPTVYVVAMDRGEQFSLTVNFSLAVVNAQRLIPGL